MIDLILLMCTGTCIGDFSHFHINKSYFPTNTLTKVISFIGLIWVNHRVLYHIPSIALSTTQFTANFRQGETFCKYKWAGKYGAKIIMYIVSMAQNC